MQIVGQVISGNYGKVLIRQKANENIELGELLIAENPEGKIIMQAFDLVYGSQISQQNLELISGIKIEEQNDLELMDFNLRNYTLAYLKPLVMVKGNEARTCKLLPAFFSGVRRLEKEDLSFITKPKHPLFVGSIRSGSKNIGINVYLEGDKVFSHHILIPAQTGKGKSNLAACMLWNLMEEDYAGILVLDPHDEYYGRDKIGLKEHKNKDKLVYYTTNSYPGSRSLKFNLRNIRPGHFQGVIGWSDAQYEALYAYYKNYGEEWIEAIIQEREIKNFMEGTLNVLKRRMLAFLDLYSPDGKEITSKGIFGTEGGNMTIKDITTSLEQGKIVIIDTSSLSGEVEILIGGLIATEIFRKYQNYKTTGELNEKPVISIVLEEAPRVLGKDVLERGPNIFSIIAREGRKFKIGLTAITQLPSLIPRTILANMSTKIIFGIEMGPERQAIIESAAQDLSEDNRNIASLEKGEAIITSNFSKFAMPVKIPLFEDLAKGQKAQISKTIFAGMRP